MKHIEKDDIEHENNNQKEYFYEDIFRIYKYKLRKIRNHDKFKSSAEKLYNLVEQNQKQEISKKSFMILMTKVLKFILPIFNYDEFGTYLENHWTLISKKLFFLILVLILSILQFFSNLFSNFAISAQSTLIY